MGGNFFDSLENTMMNAVGVVFGYDATWQPSAGGALQSARVLYNAPTAESQVQVAKFLYVDHSMEYKAGLFAGLKEAVDNTRNKEQVTVNGVLYNCRRCKLKYDGKTYVVTLEPAE